MNDNFNQAIATILNPIKSNGLEMTQMMMQYLLSLRKMDADAKKQKLEELAAQKKGYDESGDEISKLINTKLDENLNFRFREIGKQRAELLTSSVMELANERIKTGLGYDKTMLMNSPTYYKVLALKNDRTIENAAKLSKSYNESDEELKKGIYYGINDIIGKSYIDYYTSSPTQYQRFLDQLNFKYFYESEPIAEYKKQGTKDDLAKYFSGLGSIKQLNGSGVSFDDLSKGYSMSEENRTNLMTAIESVLSEMRSDNYIYRFMDEYLSKYYNMNWKQALFHSDKKDGAPLTILEARERLQKLYSSLLDDTFFVTDQKGNKLNLQYINPLEQEEDGNYKVEKDPLNFSAFLKHEAYKIAIPKLQSSISINLGNKDGKSDELDLSNAQYSGLSLMLNGFGNASVEKSFYIPKNSRDNDPLIDISFKRIETNQVNKEEVFTGTNSIYKSFGYDLSNNANIQGLKNIIVIPASGSYDKDTYKPIQEKKIIPIKFDTEGNFIFTDEDKDQLPGVPKISDFENDNGPAPQQLESNYVWMPYIYNNQILVTELDKDSKPVKQNNGSYLKLVSLGTLQMGVDSNGKAKSIEDSFENINIRAGEADTILSEPVLFSEGDINYYLKLNGEPIKKADYDLLKSKLSQTEIASLNKTLIRHNVKTLKPISSTNESRYVIAPMLFMETYYHIPDSSESGIEIFERGDNSSDDKNKVGKVAKSRSVPGSISFDSDIYTMSLNGGYHSNILGTDNSIIRMFIMMPLTDEQVVRNNKQNKSNNKPIIPFQIK